MVRTVRLKAYNRLEAIVRIHLWLVVLLFAAYPAGAEIYFIPAAASTAGAYGTNWRTEAVLLNPGAEPVYASLLFLEANQENRWPASGGLTIPAGNSIAIDDLVGNFFSLPGKAGAVEVQAQAALVITTRTYNDLGEAGTYGQGIPGVRRPHAADGEVTILPGPLVSNEHFRTNLGFVSGASGPLHLEVRFSWAGGSEAAVRQLDLQAFEYVQWNDPFRNLTAGPVEDGSVEIFNAIGGPLFAWASVADNRTGDPSYYAAPGWEEIMLADPAPEIRTAGAAGDEVAHAVWADPTGGALFLGETETADAGIDVWWRWDSLVGRFSGPGEDKAFSVHPSHNGGALMTGGTTSTSGRGWDGWYRVFSQDGFSDGNRSKILGTLEDEWIYSAVEREDRSLRLVGQTFTDGAVAGDAWVVAANNDGSVDWQYRYGGPGQDWIYAVVPLDGGGILAAGATDLPGAGGLDGWLLALDADGGILWQKSYGGPGDDMFYGLAAAADGQFVAAGQTHSWGAGGWDAWILKVAPDGTPLWQTVLGALGADTLFAADAAGDDIVLAGQRGEDGPGGGQAWVVRMTGDGGLRWQVEAGGGQAERLYGVSVAADGRIWAAGRTSSAGAGGKDALLMILEPDGSLGSACGFMTAVKAVPQSIPAASHATAAVRHSTAAAALAADLAWESVESAEERVCGPAGEPLFTWIIPAAAHVDGANGTHWRTDLAVRNMAQQANPVEIRYFQADRADGVPLTAAFDLQAGALLVLEDVLGATFGAPGSHGSLEIRAALAAAVTSRTYTPSPNGGTYGQAIPGIRKAEAFKCGETGLLAGLVRDAEFRTNAGVTSVSDHLMTVEWAVFRSDGTPLGSLAADLGPRGHLQVNDFLGRFSAEELDGAWAAISSGSENAAYFAYVSVADNRTGDPVYIPAVRQVRVH